MAQVQSVAAAAVYVGSVVVANTMTARLGLVPIGFGLVVTAGTFAAGVSLVARDWVQQTSPRLAVPVLIVVAALVSAITASPALALASGIAFLVSEVVDWGVFTPVRRRSLPLAVVVSSVVSAPVDTIGFLWLAGFPVTVSAVAGQFIVKTAIALAVALLIAAKGR